MGYRNWAAIVLGAGGAIGAAPTPATAAIVANTKIMLADGTYTTAGAVAALASGGTTVAPAISVSAPPTAPTASAAFTLTAALSGYASQPALSASVDGGTATALPSPTFTPATGVPTSVSWTQAGLTAAAHTIQLRDGNGVQSNTVTITPTAASTAPGQVTGVGVGTATASTLAVVWTAPSSGGAPTGYTLTVTPSGGSAQTVVTGSTANSYTLTALTAGTTYAITVTATNSVGSGTASAAASGTTTAAAAGLAMVSDTYGSGVFGQALTGGGGKQTLTMAGANSDYTVEFWFKAPSAAPAKTARVFSTSDAAHPFRMTVDTGKNPFIQFTENYGNAVPAGAVDGNWHHIAVYSSAAAGRFIALDGVPVNPGGHLSPPTASWAWVVQATGTTGNTFFNDAASNGLSGPGDGYGSIDEMRISNVARYTSATFTPPSAAFTKDANTVALYHFDGSGASS